MKFKEKTIKKRDQRELQIVQCMAKDFRISYCQISRTLDIPVSTIFDIWQRIQDKYVFVLLPKKVIEQNYLYLSKRNVEKFYIKHLDDLTTKRGDIDVDKTLKLLVHK